MMFHVLNARVCGNGHETIAFDADCDNCPLCDALGDVEQLKGDLDAEIEERKQVEADRDDNWTPVTVRAEIGSAF